MFLEGRLEDSHPGRPLHLLPGLEWLGIDFSAWRAYFMSTSAPFGSRVLLSALCLPQFLGVSREIWYPEQRRIFSYDT